MKSEPSANPLLILMRQAIEEDLRETLDFLHAEKTEGLTDMMAYHFGWSDEKQQKTGKRLRPVIVLLGCAALGGDWQTALASASAIELIHNFSLVHDDIEDMSPTRRGRTTIWKRWGIAKAINLGDAIFALSHLSLLRLEKKGLAPEIILRLTEILAQACIKLTIGQQLDLTYQERERISEEDYLAMISGKTSALLSASAACGATIAGGSSRAIAHLADYGHHLGLAFQIQDDILGIWGDTSKTGKGIHEDFRSRKKTLPVIYGLASSEEFQQLWSSDFEDEMTFERLRHALEASHALQLATEKAEHHIRMALIALDALEIENDFYAELRKMPVRLRNRET